MQKSARPHWSRVLQLGILFIVGWAIVLLLSNYYLIPPPLPVFHEDMLLSNLSHNNALVFEKSLESSTLRQLIKDENVINEEENLVQVTSSVKGLLQILNSTEVN